MFVKDINKDSAKVCVSNEDLNFLCKPSTHDVFNKIMSKHVKSDPFELTFEEIKEIVSQIEGLTWENNGMYDCFRDILKQMKQLRINNKIYYVINKDGMDSFETEEEAIKVAEKQVSKSVIAKAICTVETKTITEVKEI